METKRKLSLIIDITFWIFWGVAGYLFLKYCIIYLTPFLISFGIIYLLQKPMIFLSNKTGLPKNILTLVFLAVMLASLLGGIVYALLAIIDFLSDFLRDGSAADSIEGIALRAGSLLEGMAVSLPEPIKGILSLSPEKLFESGASYGIGIISKFVKSAVSALPALLVSTVISVVSACFFAFRYDSMIFFLKRQLTPSSIEKIKKIKHTFDSSLWSIIKGYLILLLITFSEMAIGLAILKSEHYIALALIIALVDMLPIFGTGTVLIPWGIFEIFSSNLFLGVGLIALYLISISLRYFLEPKIIGKQVGVEPLVSLFAMFLGLKLFGLLGLILFPLSVAVLVALHNEGIIRLWK